jgi:hypothetical protein
MMDAGMTKKNALLTILLACGALAACGSRPAATAAEAEAEAEGERATVRFVAVETGCWVLETQAGRVQPIDLPQEFRIDGLEVSVVLRDAPAMMSLCQVGPLKTIEKIAKR